MRDLNGAVDKLQCNFNILKSYGDVCIIIIKKPKPNPKPRFFS